MRIWLDGQTCRGYKKFNNLSSTVHLEWMENELSEGSER